MFKTAEVLVYHLEHLIYHIYYIYYDDRDDKDIQISTLLPSEARSKFRDMKYNDYGIILKTIIKKCRYKFKLNNKIISNLNLNEI